MLACDFAAPVVAGEIQLELRPEREVDPGRVGLGEIHVVVQQREGPVPVFREVYLDQMVPGGLDWRVGRPRAGDHERSRRMRDRNHTHSGLLVRGEQVSKKVGEHL